jgi:hypothetical protein
VFRKNCRKIFPYRKALIILTFKAFWGKFSLEIEKLNEKIRETTRLPNEDGRRVGRKEIDWGGGLSQFSINIAN